MKFSYTVVILITAFIFLFTAGQAEADGFNYLELEPQGANTYYQMYDFAFPAMLEALYIPEKDSPSEKIWKAVSFVNFYATPGKFHRHKGLGSGRPWRFGASLMLRTGSMLCSEQSMLAAMMVEPYAAGLALRDVQNHTFHELFMDGEWRIVDPYADNRLRNKKGESATFDDIQNYLTGKPDALQLPEVPQPRTTAYLSRFKKENYKRIRHNFGSNLAMKMLPYSFGLGIPANAAVKLLRQKRLLNNTQISMAYLTYVRNNIRATILSSSDPKGKAAEIQDWFLQNIMLEKPYTISTPPEVDEQYTARQKQLFGRTREALKLFGKLPQNEDILFYEAQCYFRLNDIKKFNSLAETLDKNRFYSAMYYRLNGEFFKKKDKHRLENFVYRHLDYPTPNQATTN